MNVVGAILLTICVSGLIGIAVARWMGSIRDFHDEIDNDG